MKVSEALSLLGCSKTELSALLGINKSAISLWGEDVPLAREYQILDLLAGREPILSNRKNQKSPSCTNS